MFLTCVITSVYCIGMPGRVFGSRGPVGIGRSVSLGQEDDAMKNLIFVMVSVCLATVAAADFEGDYAPEAWAFYDDADGSGSLDETVMFVVGGNSGVAGSTEYYIVAPGGAMLIFDAWFYNHNTAGYDRSYYSINGQRTVLSTTSGGPVHRVVGVAPGDRFALGVETDEGLYGAGELTVSNFVAAQPGDMNCDGAVNVDDVSGFVLALVDPVGYAATYSWCDIERGDMNGDTFVNGADIPALIARLAAA